jgi:hypothetical protein
MKRMIAGSLSRETRAVPGVLVGALSPVFGYVRNRIRLRWSLVGLAGAAVGISCTGLWGYLMHHAAISCWRDGSSSAPNRRDKCTGQCGHVGDSKNQNVELMISASWFPNAVGTVDEVASISTC